MNSKATQIVLSMEWIDAMYSKDKRNRYYKELPLEIIQIAAVKIDKLNIVDEFKVNIRPKRYVLDGDFKALTGLKYADLINEKTFVESYLNFKKWCGNDFELVVWTRDTTRALRSSLNYHFKNQDVSFLDRNRAYSLQHSLMKHFDTEHSIGLERARIMFGVPKIEVYRDVLEKAKTIARVYLAFKNNADNVKYISGKEIVKKDCVNEL